MVEMLACELSSNPKQICPAVPSGHNFLTGTKASSLPVQQKEST
jgi:hypothetical protein